MAAVGVADHSGWAVLMTVDRAGNLLDRRRVELVEEGVPVMPHHHDAQGLPIDEGVALVERVRASADRCSQAVLAALADAAPGVSAIALRALQPLPPTVAERITDYRAHNVADWVMYRQALADAAMERGWTVHWYDPKTVNTAAAAALGLPSIDGHLKVTAATAGRPWQADHRQAMAAAIAALG